jgi:uncharacterized protein (TIGR03435 family)
MGNALRKPEVMVGILMLAVCTAYGQTPQSNQVAQVETATNIPKPLAFDVVSVKPAPPGSFPLVPPFMRDKSAPVVGLQRMALPVWLIIAYAYHLQMNEARDAVRKLPDWVRTRIYTETFRVEGNPSIDQVREMMRTMLADRFSLQLHDFTREGAVNKLVMAKPGVLGPNLKPHPEGASCTTQEAATVGKAPDASAPAASNCGFVWYHPAGGILHVEKKDTTIVDAARALAGIGVGELDTRPIVDATGLTGKYDVTIEFRSYTTQLIDPDADDGGVPTLIRALKEQLGIRVENGQGPVRVIVVDHISEPTPD